MAAVQFDLGLNLSVIVYFDLHNRALIFAETLISDLDLSGPEVDFVAYLEICDLIAHHANGAGIQYAAKFENIVVFAASEHIEKLASIEDIVPGSTNDILDS